MNGGDVAMGVLTALALLAACAAWYTERRAQRELPRSWRKSPDPRTDTAADVAERERRTREQIQRAQREERADRMRRRS